MVHSGRFILYQMRGTQWRLGPYSLVQEGMNYLSGEFYINLFSSMQCIHAICQLVYVSWLRRIHVICFVYAYFYWFYLQLISWLILPISMLYTCMIESSATCHNKKRFLYCWARITSKFGRCDRNWTPTLTKASLKPVKNIVTIASYLTRRTVMICWWWCK